MTKAQLDEIYAKLISEDSRPLGNPEPCIFYMVTDCRLQHAIAPLPPSPLPRKLLARLRRGIRRSHPRTPPPPDTFVRL